ncbi:MAG: heavy metal translocating P-type ATPase [Gammaproteobacteria bacterium]|nr:heavy metal translocating P-type ATPase [Gammaproteobacteria bacterium]
MSCQHCINAVEKAALAVEGVSSASVKLDDGYVEVTGGVPHQVIDAVKKTGYIALQEPQTPDSCTAEPNRKTAARTTSAPEINGINYDFQIEIGDMTCSACVANVEQAIRSVSGVTEARINLIEKHALVAGGDPQQVVNAVIDLGYAARLRDQNTSSDRLTLLFQEEVSGIELGTLLKKLGSEIEQAWPQISLISQLHPADLLLQLKNAGYPATLIEQFTDPYQEQAKTADREIRISWHRAALAGGVGIGLMGGEMSGLFPALKAESGQVFWASMALLCLFTIWFSGRNYYRTAIKQARHLSSNMDTLIALGTAAAWIASLIVIINPDFIPGGGNHLYLDASVMILAFLQLGHCLETRAKRVTSEAIGALVNLAPKSARVVRNGGETDIPVSLLHRGDLIRIRPGETLPIDGEIIEGKSSVDESMLTGEPLAMSKNPGDPVTGGTSNRGGSFIFRVTRLGEETTLAHIITLVKQAQISKPPIAKLVDKVSSVFVPVVILIAIITFALWQLLGPDPQLAYALTAAIAVLVIACPCALGLATPIAIMVGTGRAAQLNILIKNSDALQSASHLSHLVVDKTGTLTEGHPTVTEIHPHGDLNRQQLLQLALSMESNSEHPLAEAIRREGEQQRLVAETVTDFNTIPGRGIEGNIGDTHYFLGNHHYMADRDISIDTALNQIATTHAKHGSTPVWLAKSNTLLGLLILKDPLRSESKIAIRSLHEQGIKVVICTGDNRETANAIAQELGIDRVYSEQLPEQKLAVISELQTQGFKVGMVGDGINDTPALAQADTGFAIGSGTDVAIESADITLAGNSLTNVSTAIAISSATLLNIKQNLFGAFIYNVIGIPLAAGLLFPLTGWLLHPMFASLAMAMSSVTVVTNANRLRFFKPQTRERPMAATIQLKITGMNCGHCSASAQKALEAVAGVEYVEVTLEPGGATVTGSAGSDALIAAVKEAGYGAEVA